MLLTEDDSVLKVVLKITFRDLVAYKPLAYKKRMYLFVSMIDGKNLYKIFCKVAINIKKDKDINKNATLRVFWKYVFIAPLHKCFTRSTSHMLRLTKNTFIMNG